MISTGTLEVRKPLAIARSIWMHAIVAGSPGQSRHGADRGRSKGCEPIANQGDAVIVEGVGLAEIGDLAGLNEDNLSVTRQVDYTTHGGVKVVARGRVFRPSVILSDSDHDKLRLGGIKYRGRDGLDTAGLPTGNACVEGGLAADCGNGRKFGHAVAYDDNRPIALAGLRNNGLLAGSQFGRRGRQGSERQDAQGGNNTDNRKNVPPHIPADNRKGLPVKVLA